MIKYLGKIKPKKELFWWSALLLLLFIFHFHYSGNSDDGVLLTGAWNLINDRQLYVDTFEFVPPANFYIIFWLWKIFSVNYFSAKLLAILLVFLSAFTLYKIAEKIKPSKYNFLIPLGFILSTFYWTIINYNTFNMCFLVFASYFFIQGLDSKTAYKNFIAAGLLSGTSIMFLQQKGLAGLGAFGLFLLFSYIKERNIFYLKSFFVYSISSLLPLLFLLNWPLKIIYEHLILFPFFNYTDKGMVGLDLFFIFFLIFLGAVYLLKNEKDKKIKILLLVQFFLLGTAVLRADIFHINLSIFPLFILSPLLVRRLSEKKLFFSLGYSLICSAGILAILWPSFYYGFFTLDKKIYGLFHKNDQNPILQYVEDNCPGEEDLYAGAFIPQYYFLTKKISPTPYSLLVYGINNSEQMNETAEILKEKRPSCALINYRIVEKFNYDRNNPVDEFIIKNYDLVFVQGDNSMYRIKN